MSKVFPNHSVPSVYAPAVPESKDSQPIMKSRCNHTSDETHNHDQHQPKIIAKVRTGLTTSSTTNLPVNYQPKFLTIPTTIKEMQAKKEALHQETLRKRNLRKVTRNKALAVAKNKYERRRIAKGATAQELLNSYPVVKVQRARTSRREEQRQLKKLSLKFSTKRVDPYLPKIIADETAKSE